MSNGRYPEVDLARALYKVFGSEVSLKMSVWWQARADDVILALAGRAVFVSKEDYDRLVKAARNGSS